VSALDVMSPGSEYGNPDESRDLQLAALAAIQHGVVSWLQLREIGFTKHAVHARVAAGRLHRVHRGVYAVGHTKISLRARWMAAVLACGPEAVLSHRAAAALLELRAAPSGPIDVTAAALAHRLPGIRCHVARQLHPDDRTKIDGIPVTTLSRLLLDLAETDNPRRLRSTLEAAQRADLLNVLHLEATMARSPGRHSLKPLAAALEQLNDEAPWTQSELETRFLELVRHAGLPAPHCNVVVDGVPVDFHWPAHNLIVEVDGFRYHRTRASFEDDRRRDTRHAVAGRRSVRLTHQRIVYEQREMLSDLRKLISAGPARGASGR